MRSSIVNLVFTFIFLFACRVEEINPFCFFYNYKILNLELEYERGEQCKPTVDLFGAKRWAGYVRGDVWRI